MIELVGLIIALLGAVFTAISALGLLKLNTLFMKMHAATKSGTLGSGLLLLGVGLQLKSLTSITEIILLIIFIALTNPLSSHLIANVSFRGD